MQELIGIIWKVIVDGHIDTFNINTTSKQIRTDQDPCVKVLEGLVLGDTFLLTHTSMDANGRKVAFCQEAVEFLGTADLGNKNDNLIKLESIQKVIELSILLCFRQLDVVQLQTVQRELRIVIDIDFHRILTKLLANGTNFLGERSTKHHDLFLVRCHAEDILNISTHIQTLQDAITLIKHKVFNVIQFERLLLGQTQNTTGSTNDNVWTIVLENITIGFDRDATIKDSRLDIGQILAETFVFMSNLKGQLTSMTQDQNLNVGCLLVRRSSDIQLMQRCQNKDSRLSHTRFGLTDDIHTKYSLWNTLVLDF
mmetsp:Transcript_47826/g.71188  ORF Transcript_47826/g.71188 Transcript_47826/m.71188 type:complete len:311 (-) Transcript_47826:910-1842(-)